MEQDTIHQQIKALLSSENLAVLATQNRERPYTSLVTFSFSENLKEVYVCNFGDVTEYHP